TIKLHGVQQKNTALRVGFAVISAAGKIVEQQWMQAVDHDQFGVQVSLTNPLLWSPLAPNLYKARFRLYLADKLVDEYSLSFGIRTFRFDRVAGFFINNKPLKIQGVCMHHDLGALGAAFHPDAAMRQLQILKQMGCNAIRFAHNPPATPLLDMCDELGFLVVDEAFDMWKKRKTKFDYHQYFDQWHVPDLRAMVLRDRNHPSIIMWSIGNEIREQFDSTGITIAKRLAALVKELDTTRPVTSALTEMIPEKNFITQSGSLDVLSFNYKEYDYAALPARFPDAAFVASETASALASRGVYVNGTDSMLIWPASFREQDSFNKGYTDYTCNAYDNTAAYWGTTHQRAWLAVKRYPFISGAFVWSGFDYLGEPLPYLFPARSSYFGIIDLAGFPKDVYYMYQAEWTTKPVLHLLPHWNWQIGDTVNVWAYYSQADEVELFLNGKSLGAQQKSDTSLHVRWRVPYAPGVLLAVSKKEGRPVMKTQVETTDKLAQVLLAASINKPSLQRRPLSFVTIQLADALGRAISHTDVMVKVQIASNSARLLGLDNGYQADTTSLQSPLRQTFKGKLLAIIEHTNHKQPVVLKVQAQGLPAKTITLPARHTME
ncbi:MAG TPA: glycoside hydrolase family 2 TIM barrel-domain containing protein, partial [Phnomibacter sp.]|nr:glycoside hydrolase family 2 TIM barrel-domain containing protein [Phnomibacter sp.]